MHYPNSLCWQTLSVRINTRREHWLSIAETTSIPPLMHIPIQQQSCCFVSLLTGESVVNTCAVFLLCPLSVAVTYPNVLGYKLSRTTQQTLLISWEVTSSCKNTKKNHEKLYVFAAKFISSFLGTAICQEALSFFTTFFWLLCSTIWNASILCKTS